MQRQESLERALLRVRPGSAAESAIKRAITSGVQKAKHAKGKFCSGKNGTGYHSRNSYLKNMGFASYQDYLASDIWKGIREQVYATKGSLCFTCSGAATVLHHLRYSREDLLGETLENIVPLCRTCHHEFEFSAGVKVSLSSALDAYRSKREVYLSQANEK